MDKRKISIVAIFHNQEKLVSRCLDSLLHQTYKNTEIICVDDASSDRTCEILKEYADRWSNVKIIRLETNSSENVARKRGVEAATGKYLLFVDGDDSLKKNACKVLIREMVKDPVDILQFGVNIIFSDHVPESERQEMLEWYEGSERRLVGEEITRECFIGMTCPHNIWGKLYRTGTIKKAFESIEEKQIYFAEDYYQYLIISYKAESFRSIKIQNYNYYYGEGITASEKGSLANLEQKCSSIYAADAIKRFAQRKKDPLLYEIAKMCRLQFFRECMNTLKELGYSDEGMSIICRYFNIFDIISKYDDYFFENLHIKSMRSWKMISKYRSFMDDTRIGKGMCSIRDKVLRRK